MIPSRYEKGKRERKESGETLSKPDRAMLGSWASLLICRWTQTYDFYWFIGNLFRSMEPCVWKTDVIILEDTIRDMSGSDLWCSAQNLMFGSLSRWLQVWRCSIRLPCLHRLNTLKTNVLAGEYPFIQRDLLHTSFASTTKGSRQFLKLPARDDQISLFWDSDSVSQPYRKWWI